MSAARTEWKEVVGRGTAITLMHNFTSVADALKELVDNAVDYRWNQRLRIEIWENRRRDTVVVDSDGFITQFP